MQTKEGAEVPADLLPSSGVAGGGPCVVTIELTFEAAAATKLPELWRALVAIYGEDRIGVDSGRELPVGGGVYGYRWRVAP